VVRRRPYLSQFLRDVVSELRQVTWPANARTRRGVIVVVVTMAVIAVVIAVPGFASERGIAHLLG
jgi:preprotein translocase SecE subunit